MHTEGICFQSCCPCPPGECVGVNGYKEVGLVAIGYIGSLVERDEHVGFACVYYFYIRTIILHEPSEGKRHVEIDILLLGESANRTGVMSSMPGVDDKREILLGCHGHNEHEYHYYRSNNPSIHIYIIIFRVQN